ncbi:MAG: lipocalin family protein [Flavobacteriales bacterium]|nr:lipocalin family protein [Flavobacteriales bacterium]
MNLSQALTICGILVLGLITTAFYSLSIVVHPEARLAGTWKEVAWSYEKVDHDPNGAGISSFFDNQLRSEISKDLIIHDSETWTFHKDRTLTLSKSGQANTRLKWNLKGRGHILGIEHASDQQEHYQIRELTDDRLVLHFNNDMIVRGIVKIEFERTTETTCH